MLLTHFCASSVASCPWRELLPQQVSSLYGNFTHTPKPVQSAILQDHLSDCTGTQWPGWAQLFKSDIPKSKTPNAPSLCCGCVCAQVCYGPAGLCRSLLGLLLFSRALHRSSTGIVTALEKNAKVRGPIPEAKEKDISATIQVHSLK